MVDDTFLILVNAADQGVEYVLPHPPGKDSWHQVLDTEDLDNPFHPADADEKVILGGRSIRVFSNGKKPAADAPTRHKLAKTL